MKNVQCSCGEQLNPTRAEIADCSRDDDMELQLRCPSCDKLHYQFVTIDFTENEQ